MVNVHLCIMFKTLCNTILCFHKFLRVCYHLSAKGSYTLYIKQNLIMIHRECTYFISYTLWIGCEYLSYYRHRFDKFLYTYMYMALNKFYTHQQDAMCMGHPANFLSLNNIHVLFGTCCYGNNI